MGQLIKKFGDINLWKLEKDEIPDLTFFVLDNYYMQYWNQHIHSGDDEYKEAVKEDLIHFNHGVFFVMKDTTGHILGSIKAVKIAKGGAFPLEGEFQINYSDFIQIVPESTIHDIWLFGRLIVDKEYFKSHPDLIRFRNSIYRILICQAITCMSYNPDNILIAEVDKAVCTKLCRVDIEMIPIGASKIIYASETIPVYNRMSHLYTFLNKNIHLIH